ncbi:toll-like receptor 13 [Saccostrea echinata]|uniref:toll-like receptor 13 n=1 Tax=Saccostrea echinata TaxID=191078 RepID=UPI002A831520|nr:toll-like receptor 13 [Saccostrea echinata]
MKETGLRIFNFLLFSSLTVISYPCPTAPYTDECGNFGILWNCSGLNTDSLPEKIPQKLRNRNVTLDLSFIRFSTLTEQIFENLAAVSVVTSIILSHNKITKIENKAFSRLISLCSLDLSSCELDKNGIEVEAFSYIHNLKYLRIDQNNFQPDGYPDVALSAIQPLSSLHIDIFSGFLFTAPFENLTNLSELKFHIVNDFSLTNTSFLGLRRSKIHYLNMYFKNHVYCDVTEDLFCSFPYLSEEVRIRFGGKCDITPALRSLKCFQHRNIGRIYMDQNSKDLERDFIVLDEWLSEYLINVCVRALFLQQNGINSININIYNTTLWNCLQYLDFSRNHLYVVDLSSILSLLFAPNMKNMNFCCNNPKMKNQLNFYQYNRSIISINITLSKNLEVLDVSKNYVHNVKRWTPSFKITGERLQELYIQETNFPLAYVDEFDLPSLKTLNISVAALRRYRIHVEYVILRLKNRWKGVHLKNGENKYIYDVFVSYGEKDHTWIIRDLYPKLERLNIKVWLKDRDSIPGDWEAEEIVKCINESRKVLFVITECFLESGWASYAVQMAVTHAFHNQRQSSIVVIIKDNIPLERLPNDIKNIWWCIEYLRWPIGNGENEDLLHLQLSNLFKPT